MVILLFLKVSDIINLGGNILAPCNESFRLFSSVYASLLWWVRVQKHMKREVGSYVEWYPIRQSVQRASHYNQNWQCRLMQTAIRDLSGKH